MRGLALSAISAVDRRFSDAQLGAPIGERTLLVELRSFRVSPDRGPDPLRRPREQAEHSVQWDSNMK